MSRCSSPEGYVASLHFKQDGFFKIQVVNPGLLYSEYTITVLVLGKEDLEIPGVGKTPCWKVNVNSGVGNGAIEWRAVSDHTQIKKTFDLPNGSCFKRILLNE